MPAEIFSSPLPVLYSFRRCPYAMRARLAIAQSETRCILREVLLRDKPQALLEASPKGTVPVLVTADGKVIEESLEIMQWALSHHDPQGWLPLTPKEQHLTSSLIKTNDDSFKFHLDRYKYPGRYDNEDPALHRHKAFEFIRELDAHLCKQNFLVSAHFTLADAAILPFVRQYAATDSRWFQENASRNAQKWLDDFLSSPLFSGIMKKTATWKEDNDEDAPLIFFP